MGPRRHSMVLAPIAIALGLGLARPAVAGSSEIEAFAWPVNGGLLSHRSLSLDLGRHFAGSVAEDSFSAAEYGRLTTVDYLIAMRFSFRPILMPPGRPARGEIFLGPRFIRTGVSKGHILPIVGYQQTQRVSGHLTLEGRVAVEGFASAFSTVTLGYSGGGHIVLRVGVGQMAAGSCVAYGVVAGIGATF